MAIHRAPPVFIEPEEQIELWSIRACKTASNICHKRERQHFSVKLKWDQSDFSAKNLLAVNACGYPSRPARSFQPNKGIETSLRNDSTRLRKACVFISANSAYMKIQTPSLLGTTRLSIPRKVSTDISSQKTQLHSNSIRYWIPTGKLKQSFSACMAKVKHRFPLEDHFT